MEAVWAGEAGPYRFHNSEVEMKTMIRAAVMSLLCMTLITGVIYPLVVTGIAQVIFPAQANGSLITQNGAPVGSALIGQAFDDPKYFWGRLSATGPVPSAAVRTASGEIAAATPNVQAPCRIGRSKPSRQVARKLEQKRW